MAIFDIYYLTLGVLGLVVFWAAKNFLALLLNQDALSPKSAPAVVATEAAPSESQRFILARARGFNLPRTELSRLAVVVPKPSMLFGDLGPQEQRTLKEAYKEGHSRGPEATAFLFGAPLSDKNALYLAWFKDYRLPHFFVDKHVNMA